MTQVLIAHEDKNFAKNIQAHLLKAYGVESLPFQDGHQAVAMAELLPDIKMIVVSEKFHLDVSKYLIKNNENFAEKVLVLVIGNNKSPYPFSSDIPANIPVTKIFRQIGFLLGLEETPLAIEVEPSQPPPAPVSGPEVIAEEPQEEIQEETEDKTTVFVLPKKERTNPDLALLNYRAISMKYLQKLSATKINFNIYSRIKKQDEFEFILKISANSEAKSEIERLKIRGGREIFVRKEDYQTANEFFSTSFINRFKDPSLNVRDRMLLNSEAYEILLDVFRESSFTKYTIEIIKELVKSINILFHSPEPFAAFFEGLKDQDLSYGYIHSYLSGLLIFKTIDQFPWKKDQSINKILYLALFHDLCLNNNKLIKAHHHYAREVSKLTDVEKEIIHKHADAAATILETIVKAPKELTSLIREHHGLKTGLGFLGDLSLGISPLNMAFMVTESFVTKYLDFWETTKDVKAYPEEIFNQLSEKYNKLTYADVVEALKKEIKKPQ